MVAGVDEAGRGPLAGPVVAAAVCFPGLALPPAVRGLIDDSKKLSPARRETAFAAILEAGAVGTGAASVAEIDRLNILQATLLAMQRAVAALAVPPAAALVDGNRAPALPCPAHPLVGGDRLSLSIAAASIVAKVTRDRIMARLAADYPGYGWERNAGYGVAAHRAALAALGPTPHHRRTFAPVRDLLAGIE
ncbi:MAG: ribonuclease HII [Rhodospirillaceae bacterium]|nr:ribonuclease HII [Rhodospirillaceae bacterium]